MGDRRGGDSRRLRGRWCAVLALVDCLWRSGRRPVRRRLQRRVGKPAMRGWGYDRSHVRRRKCAQNPYQAPTLDSPPAPPNLGSMVSVDVVQLRAIAKYQRMLLFCILGYVAGLGIEPQVAGLAELGWSAARRWGGARSAGLRHRARVEGVLKCRRYRPRRRGARTLLRLGCDVGRQPKGNGHAPGEWRQSRIAWRESVIRSVAAVPGVCARATRGENA